MKGMSTRLVPAITVIVLAFAGVFSYCAWRMIHSGQAGLHLSIVPIRHGYTTTLSEVALPDLGGHVVTRWLGLVTNVTEREVTIEDYHLLEVVHSGWLASSYMDQGCLHRDGTEILFPISLMPGESLVFRLAIGVGLGIESFASIGSRHPGGGDVPIGDVCSEMARLLRGQSGLLQQDAGRPPAPAAQRPEPGERRYLLELHTASGDRVSALGRWHWCQQGVL